MRSSLTIVLEVAKTSGYKAYIEEYPYIKTGGATIEEIKQKLTSLVIDTLEEEAYLSNVHFNLKVSIEKSNGNGK